MKTFLPREADVNLRRVYEIFGNKLFNELLGGVESLAYIGIVNVHPKDVHVELPSIALNGSVYGKVVLDGLSILKQGGVAFIVTRLITDVFEVNDSSVLISALY